MSRIQGNTRGQRPAAGGGGRSREALGGPGAASGVTRRGFLGWAAAAALGLGGGSALGGCSAGEAGPGPAESSEAPDGGPRDVSDMGDRSVSLPGQIDRLFCTNPIGTADLFALAPEKLVGWSQKPSAEDEKYIPEQYRSLPSLGVWRGSGSVPNVEEIAAQRPDALLCFWTVDDVGRSLADKIAGDAGLPVVLVDYDIRRAPQAYRFVGRLIGAEARAEELAAYCEERLDLIGRIAQGIPDDQLKSVYLAQGAEGLQTDPVGSMHVSDALELIRTKNVADMPGTKGKGMGMPTVNMEQLVTWSPDAVLVSEHGTDTAEGPGAMQAIATDAQWANVSCVAAGEVYRIPQSPFSWFGRPPSVARLLGCLWLLKVLYPSHAADIDMRKETLDFYAAFYRYEGFDDEALDHVLKAAGIDAATGEKTKES